LNCRETQQLIDAYADGEVDLVRSVELEAHLQDCGSCMQALTSTRAIKDAIRGASLRFEAPKGLESRMVSAVRKETSHATKAVRTIRRPLLSRTMWAAAAGILFAAVAAFAGWRALNGIGAPDTVADETVSSHVRSLMANHLFDVASTDRHTVKPWFAGKLDYSPTVIDLADRDFPLAGGRLDYISGRPVAALVYRHRKHVINLFEWPVRAGDFDSNAVLMTGSLNGYNTVRWSRSGMAYRAVSDVAMADLKQFATEIDRAAGL